MNQMSSYPTHASTATSDSESEARIDRELEGTFPASDPPGWVMGVAVGTDGQGDSYNRTTPLLPCPERDDAASGFPLSTPNMRYLLRELEALLPLAESIDARRSRTRSGKRGGQIGTDLAEGLRQLVERLTLDIWGTASVAPNRQIRRARREPQP